MTTFRLDGSNTLADSVDIARLARFLRKSLPHPTESANWSPDMWLDLAARSVGAADLHAAQTEAKRANLKMDPKALLFHEWLHDDSVPESRVPNIFPPDIPARFTKNWRITAVDALDPFYLAMSRGQNGPHAVAVLGAGNQMLVEAVFRQREGDSHIIDLAERDAPKRVEALAAEENGFVARTVAFMRLNRAPDVGTALRMCLSLAEKQPRFVNVFAIDRRHLQLLTKPAAPEEAFRSLKIIDLDDIGHKMLSPKFVVPVVSGPENKESKGTVDR